MASDMRAFPTPPTAMLGELYGARAQQQSRRRITLCQSALHGLTHLGVANMRKSTVLATFIWIWIVGGSIVQGFVLPYSDFARQFPAIPWEIAASSGVLLILLAFWGRHISWPAPFEKTFEKTIDRRLGLGSFQAFMSLLKPGLMFASMSLGFGLVGLLRTIELGGPPSALGICSFFLSGGFGFLAAHFIQRRRGLPEA